MLPCIVLNMVNKYFIPGCKSNYKSMKKCSIYINYSIILCIIEKRID